MRNGFVYVERTDKENRLDIVNAKSIPQWMIEGHIQ